MKLVLSIEGEDLEILKQIEERGNFKDSAACIAQALIILKTLQEQAAEGFTDFIVRHPKTKDARICKNVL